MIGLAIGVVSGIIQFWLLSKFTRLITSGKVNAKAVAFGLIQFFLPVGVLVASAFIVRQEIMWVGIGIIAALLIGSGIKYVLNLRKLRGREDKDD